MLSEKPSTHRLRSILNSWRVHAVCIMLVACGLFVALSSRNKPIDFSDPAWMTVQIQDQSGRFVTVKRTNDFADDFENGIERRIEGWHQHMKLASDSNAGNPANLVETTTDQVHSGRYALRTYTPKDPRDLQKAALLRELFFFPAGSDCWFSAWFYIPGSDSIENLFLFDLEATGYYGVGRRLMFTGTNGRYLMLEGKRSTGPQYSQTVSPVPFPRNQWVHVKLHLHLSHDEKGRVELWQDDVLILNKSGPNMVKNTFYDRIEVGQTANATHRELTVYVDDVKISDKIIDD